MSLHVEQFEYIKANETTALLRVAGRWPEGDPGDCVLLVSSGGTNLILDPLPQPPTTTGLWRAAYSASLRRVESPRTRFQLETRLGAVVDLPRPQLHGAAARPERPTLFGRFRKSNDAPDARKAIERERKKGEKVAADLRAQLRDTKQQHTRAAERVKALTRECERLEQALETQRHSAEAAREALDELRAVDQAEAERQRAELERLQGELARVQAELEEARESADGFLTVLDKAAEANMRFRDEIEARKESEASARATIESQEGEIASARSEARAAVELATALERNLADARASEQATRVELDEVSAAFEGERQRSASLQARLTAAKGETGELRGRIRTLEDVLTRVRSHVADSQAQLTAVDEFARTVRAAVEQTVYGGPDDADRARRRAHAIAQLREELDSRMARLEHLEAQAQGLRTAILARMDDGRSMDELFAREREPQKV